MGMGLGTGMGMGVRHWAWGWGQGGAWAWEGGRRATSVCRVACDRKELDPTELGTGGSLFRLTSGCDNERILPGGTWCGGGS